MATNWENGCPFGLKYVFLVFKYLIVNLVFSHLSICHLPFVPFPDHCLLLLVSLIASYKGHLYRQNKVRISVLFNAPKRSVLATSTSACLIMVDNYAAFFNCTPMGRASDSMMARHEGIHFGWLGLELLVCCLGHRGSTSVFLLHRLSVSY